MKRTVASSRFAEGSWRVSAPRPAASVLLGRGVLLLGLVVGLSSQAALACGKPAKADGNDGDWDRPTDFVKHMHKDGRGSGTEMTDLHLRCDPATGKAHALVMAKPGYTLDDTPDAWIKVDGHVVANRYSKDFAWVIKNGQRVGYECSFDYDYSRDHVIRAKAKVKSHSHYFAHHDYSDSGDHKHHFVCQDTTPGTITAVCGAAVVDGTVEDAWNISTTVAAELKAGTTATANLYLRYQGDTAYILVLAKEGYSVFNYADYNKVTVTGANASKVVAANSTPTTPASFAWVKNASGTKIGYEAAIKLTPGDKLMAQVKTVKNGQYLIATSPGQIVAASCGGNQCLGSKSAKVDGQTADWDLSIPGTDRLTPMVNASRLTDTTADFYVRYDANSKMAYVLVLARSGYVAINSSTYDFVKLGGKYGQIVVQPNTTGSFAWVYNSTSTYNRKLMGFEASFPLPNGNIADLYAQLKTAKDGSTYCGSEFLSQGGGTIATNCSVPQQQVGLGNRVWQEVNGLPGYQPNDGDLPLEGVTVSVLDEDGVLKGEAPTDVNGCYLVEGLTSGQNYSAAILAVDLPKGLIPVARTFDGTDDLAPDLDHPKLTLDDVVDQNGVQYAPLDYVITPTLIPLTAGAEPTGEETALTGRASCAGLRTLPDNAVNETIDFAFEAAVAIGNRVWIEKNGLPGFQGPDHPEVVAGTIVADAPKAGVAVELVKPADTPNQPETIVGLDTTDDEGCYLIDRTQTGGRIASDTYFVRIPQANFEAGGALLGSVVSNAFSDAAIVDDDGDQNGRPGVTLGAVISQLYSLAAGAAPTDESGTDCTKSSTLPDSSVDLTADFSFDQKVAIGNLVWIEKNANPGYQSTGTDADAVVTDGVKVLLHKIGDTGFLQTTATTGGFYLFDQLSPGTYYVEIPATEFQATKPLAGYEPAIGAGGDDAVDDGDGVSAQGDHNGQPVVSPDQDGVHTLEFVLEPGLEPTEEAGLKSTDPVSTPSVPTLTSALPDSSVNLSADFAFIKTTPIPQALAGIGSTLWIDVNGNGVQGSYGRKDPVTQVVTQYPEPVIGGCQVRVYGPIGDPNNAPAENLVNTDPTDGTYFISGLMPGAYEVSIPTGESGLDCVASKLRDFYYHLNPGLPENFPALPTPTAHLTWTGTPKNAADDQIDGDNNGWKDETSGAVFSAPITLTLDAEPADDPSAVPGTPGAELDFANDTGPTAGRLKDNAGGERDGDMTVDFGFIHQCAAICDMNGDGKVTNWRSTHATGTFNTAACYKKDPVTGKTVAVTKNELVTNNVSDTDIIRCLNLTDRNWASTEGKGPGQGQPGSGDCDNNGNDSGNDATWCDVMVQPTP